MEVKVTRTKDYSNMTRAQLVKEYRNNYCKGEYIAEINEIKYNINSPIKQGDTYNESDILKKVEILNHIKKQVNQNYDELEAIKKALINMKPRMLEDLTKSMIDNDIKLIQSEQKSIKLFLNMVEELKNKISEKTKILAQLSTKDIYNYDWQVMNRIKDMLNEKNIDQSWLSDKLGMDRSTISSLLSNKTSTTMSNAFKIAYLLDMSVDDLFYTGGQVVWAKTITDSVEGLFKENKHKYYSTNIKGLFDSVIENTEQDDFCMPQVAESEAEYNVEKINKEQVKNKIELVIEGDKLSSDKIEEYFKGKGKIKKVSIEYEDIDNIVIDKNSKKILKFLMQKMDKIDIDDIND